VKFLQSPEYQRMTQTNLEKMLLPLRKKRASITIARVKVRKKVSVEVEVNLNNRKITSLSNIPNIPIYLRNHLYPKI